MAKVLTHVERQVLAAYKTEDERDSEAALAPYYHTIVAAAGGPDLAYAACKSLARQKLLKASGRAGTALASAPSYWITDEGKAAE